MKFHEMSRMYKKRGRVHLFSIDRAAPPVKTSQMTSRGIIDRISPLWLGIGISGSLLVVMFVIETALGRWSGLLVGGEFDPLAKVSEGMLRDIRITIVHCLVIGYLPAALLHALRSGRRTVLALQKSLDCTVSECNSLAASVQLSKRGLLITGLVGLLLASAAPYFTPPVPPAPWNPATWSPEVAWHRTLGPLTMIWGLWLIYTIVTVSVRMSHIANTLARVDLLDLSPLAPFTQLGLTNSLLSIGTLSIWSLVMIETGFGQMMVIIGGATLIGTAFAMLVPVHGVHKRICQSKEEALGWVNGQIVEQQVLFQGAQAGQPSGRMADLVTYRGMVQDVPEWPFTLSTYMRVALYVLLPVAAWGFGIVAEEIMARVLF